MSTTIITSKVRLVYPSLFKKSKYPADAPEETARYSATLLIPKSDVEEIKKINAILTQIAKDNNCKLGVSGYHNPLKDGDKVAENNPETDAKKSFYSGHYFIRTKSLDKPFVIGLDNVQKNSDEENEVYGGCYVRASVSFLHYGVKGLKGIIVKLNGVRKVGNGEHLGVSNTALSDLQNLDIEPEEEINFLS